MPVDSAAGDGGPMTLTAHPNSRSARAIAAAQAFELRKTKECCTARTARSPVTRISEQV